MLPGFVVGDRPLGRCGDTHPGWMMAHAVAGPYVVAGASALGRLHRLRGAPRDDAFVVRAAGPWLAAVVADGVGSRPLSRYGATFLADGLGAELLRLLIPPLRAETLTATTAETGTQAARETPNIVSLISGLDRWAQCPGEEAQIPAGFPQVASVGWWPPEGQRLRASPPALEPCVDVAQSGIDADAQAARRLGVDVAPAPEADLQQILQQAFAETRRSLCEHARKLDLQLSDLGSTVVSLLLNVETATGVAGQVGDGAILGLTAGGKVRQLVEPPSTGDPQATYTLNQSDFDAHLAYRLIRHEPADPFVAFYVMTDGLAEDLLYAPNEELEDWAQKVEANLRRSATPEQAALGMSNWLANYQGSWDDRTLVAILRKERVDGNR